MSAVRDAVLFALRAMDEYDGDDAEVNLHELADLLEAVTQPLVDFGVFEGWNSAARAAARSAIIDLVRAMYHETETECEHRTQIQVTDGQEWAD
jgi:hypothetical protein